MLSLKKCSAHDLSLLEIPGSSGSFIIQVLFNMFEE